MPLSRRIVILALLLAALPLAAQEESPSASRKEPPPNPADKYKIDGSAEWYQNIRDNTAFPWLVKNRELGDDAALHMEEFAYEDALIHAAKFTHAELEEHARRDVLFASLCNSSRLDYKLELVRFEGRLRRLQRVEVTPNLKLHNVEAVYEAWVFPTGETTPLCVIVSELPEGLAPQKDVMKETLNRPVAVTGYYFKLLKYEQMGFDHNNPGKHKVWAAPFLIGRSLTLLPEEALVDSGSAWQNTFVPIIVVGFTAVALTLAFLSWRYRRGDRAILERALEKRNRNPFENV